MLVEFNPSLTTNYTQQWEDLLAFNSVSQSSDWLYALILIAIFAGFRLISLILLNEKAKNFTT